MTDFTESLPVSRTLVHQEIGQLVGIFQIDRNTLQAESEARALAVDGPALVAIANGGKLSETAFNVWTLLSQMFAEASCPGSNRVDSSLSAFARRIWGDENGRSAERRRRVADALDSLLETQVVVVGMDPYTFERSADAIWKMNLLESVGAIGDVKTILKRARSDDEQEQLAALAELAGLRSDSRNDRATWSVVLPGWLAESIRRGAGIILDYDVQRQLRGSAKRIWVQLQTHPTWTDHTLPIPSDEDELLALVDPLTARPGTPTVVPAPDEPSITVQSLVIDMDNDAYEAFGITHANRKRDLTAACRSIIRVDPTYLTARVAPVKGRTKTRRHQLHLVRATGALRQERLRLATRERNAAKNPTRGTRRARVT